MMEENVYDGLYEVLLRSERQLRFQLHEYVLDRLFDKSDSVVKDIKKKLAEIEEEKKMLLPKTTRYKNK